MSHTISSLVEKCPHLYRKYLTIDIDALFKQEGIYDEAIVRIEDLPETGRVWPDELVRSLDCPPCIHLVQHLRDGLPVFPNW